MCPLATLRGVIVVSIQDVQEQGLCSPGSPRSSRRPVGVGVFLSIIKDLIIRSSDIRKKFNCFQSAERTRSGGKYTKAHFRKPSATTPSKKFSRQGRSTTVFNLGSGVRRSMLGNAGRIWPVIKTNMYKAGGDSCLHMKYSDEVSR